MPAAVLKTITRMRVDSTSMRVEKLSFLFLFSFNHITLVDSTRMRVNKNKL
jgi:hypothetical protein